VCVCVCVLTAWWIVGVCCVPVGATRRRCGGRRVHCALLGCGAHGTVTI